MKEMCPRCRKKEYMMFAAGTQLGVKVFQNETRVCMACGYDDTSKPQCPKCKGSESPNSIEPVDLVYWKCFECGEIFKPLKKGRPSLGMTKKISLTLSDETWSFIQDVMNRQEMSQSEALRNVIERSIKLPVRR